MKLKQVSLAVALIIYLGSLSAFAQEEVALIRTLVNARDTLVVIKGELKQGDVRKTLLSFLREDMSEGILAIRKELVANKALASQNYPNSKKIERTLEKILGSAYLNLRADQLLADTPIFENASELLTKRIGLVRQQLEGLRDLYFKDPARVALYRQVACARFSLQALGEIITMAPSALSGTPNASVKDVQEAALALRLSVKALLDNRERENFASIIVEERSKFKNASWDTLNTNLKNLRMGGSGDIEGNYNAVVQTQFNFELLKNMWSNKEIWGNQ